MVASVIDALLITLGVDSSGVKSGMAQAENTIAASAKNIMNNILAPLAAALAVGSAFKEYLAGAQAVGNLANTLNENQEDMQSWAQAVERAGGDASAFEGSLVSLNSKMLEFAQTGTSSAAPALAQLGISARDSNGNIKSSIDIISELARVADTMDPARFQALTSSLGIDSGTLLLLKQGSMSVDELVARQKLLGVYTAEDSAIATKMGNAIKDLMQVLKSISTVIMRFVLPPLTWLTDKMVEFVLFIREHEVFLRAVITGIAAVLTAVLLPAMIKIGAAALANPLTWIFLIVAAAVVAVSLLIEDLYVYMKGGQSALSGFWSMFGSGEEVAAKLSNAWAKLKEFFSSFLDVAVKNFKLLVKTVANLVDFVLTLGSYLGYLFNLITSIFTFDGQEITKAFEGLGIAGEKLKDIFLVIIEYVKGSIPYILQWIGVFAGAAVIIKTILLIGAGISNIIGFIKGVITAWQIFTALIAANPIGAILTAITIALMLIVQNWDKIKEAAGIALDWINEKLASFKGFLQNLADSIKQFFQPIIDYIKNTIAAITDALTPIFDKINSVRNFAGGIKDKISGGIEAVASFFGGDDEDDKNKLTNNNKPQPTVQPGPITSFLKVDNVSPAAALPNTINNNTNNITSTNSVNVGTISVVSNNADPKQVAKEIPAAMNNYNSYIPANAAVAY